MSRIFRLFVLQAAIWGSLILAAQLPSAPGLCSKSPLLQWNWQSVSPALASDLPQSSQVVDQNARRIEAEVLTTDDNPWIGPHACVASFCVYSNPAFARGQGIAVVKTARNVGALANISGGILSSRVPAKSDKSQYAVRPIPGKGLGLVATRRIRRGERIMASFPAIVAHTAMLDELSRADRERLLAVAVEKLPSVTKTALLALMAHSNNGEIGSIMDTNSFTLTLAGARGEKSEHFGCWPDVSRFNHDCRPNVAFYISNNLEHISHAIRDIVPGEELSITYLDSFRSRSVRQARIHRSWGFNCSCSHCTLPESQVNASDHRLWRLYELEQSLMDWNAPRTEGGSGFPINSDAVELLLSLYAQEGLLDSHGADALTLAALNFNSLGREALAVKYGLRSLEQGLLEYGESGHDVMAMVDLLRSPKNHWSWRKRVRDVKK